MRMKLDRKNTCILLALFILGSLSVKNAHSNDSELKRADRLYGLRNREADARAALQIYDSLASKEPANAELLWRAAMANYFVAYRYEKKPEVQETHFAKGLALGRSAIHTAPECGPCYFWTAINLTLWAEKRGTFRSLASLKEIRKLLARSLEIDPKYAYGGAHRLLGIIDSKLPQVIGGDRYRARENLLAAIADAPDEPMNYLELARLEWKSFQNHTRAAKLLEEGLSLKNLPADRVESLHALSELQALQAEISPALKISEK